MQTCSCKAWAALIDKSAEDAPSLSRFLLCVFADTKIWKTPIPRAAGDNEEDEQLYEDFPEGEFGPAGRLPDNASWGRVEIPSTHGPVVKVSAGELHSLRAVRVTAVVTMESALLLDANQYAKFDQSRTNLQPCDWLVPKSVRCSAFN